MTLSIEKLKQLRKHNGWSQERLADISGVSLRTIQRIEGGENASFESQLSLAKAFDVAPSELLSNDDILVGHGGINWSGIVGLSLCFALMLLQFRLGSAPFFDSVSLALVIGLSLGLSAISQGAKATLNAIALIKWIFLLPKNEIGLQRYLPSLNRFILYSHTTGAISSLVGVIAVFMTPESFSYTLQITPKYPMAFGFGIALLTSLYAAMFAELVLRPLKHQIERLLVETNKAPIDKT